MTSINLQEWIDHPEQLDKESLYELRNVLARYPYFQTVRLLYLKNLYLLHDVSFGEELRKAALYVTDRRILFYLIEGDKFVIRPVLPERTEKEEAEPGLDRTLDLIDAFLSTIPSESNSSAELDISTDYIAYLLQEKEVADRKEVQKKPVEKPETKEQKKREEFPAEAPRLKGQHLIDDFIEKADSGVSMRVEFAEDEDKETYPVPESVLEQDLDDESCFTETLAKIYVKQKRYLKALEIIKKLSLKYPKKNAYFADQIRFLEKLIINTKSK